MSQSSRHLECHFNIYPLGKFYIFRLEGGCLIAENGMAAKEPTFEIILIIKSQLKSDLRIPENYRNTIAIVNLLSQYYPNSLGDNCNTIAMVKISSIVTTTP